MEKANCPQCGAEIKFISKVSVYAVCPFCASTILRVGMDLRLLGQMAALQNDPTVLQLRAAGDFEGRRFEVIGRVRQEWSEGSWNEWYLFFGDQKAGWLAEAQGELWMLFDIEVPSSQLPARDSLSPGLVVSIKEHNFEVTDIKKVRSIFSEGELPFRASQNQEFISIDLRSTTSEESATLSYSDEDVSIYTGRRVLFKDLKLTNLKQVDGW